MLYKEIGFRAVYHQICAFKFNDQLRELTKDCPEAGDSTHAVVYGYIDTKKGLMLEVLGTGKMGRKYFYFKAPWTGRRITVPMSELAELDFASYPDLDPQMYKRYLPRIEALKKYDVSENVEKSRMFPFLDGCRDPFHPDKITVRFMKDGLKAEDIPLMLTDLGDHCLIGTLLKKPRQNFGPAKGDTIEFHTMDLDDGTTICTANYNTEKIKKEDLENGTALKMVLDIFNKDRTKDNLGTVITILRSSSVYLACHAVEQDKAAEPDTDNEDGEFLEPQVLENSGHLFLSVYTSEKEYDKNTKDNYPVSIQSKFIHAVDMAKSIDHLTGIVVNPFSDNFIVDKDLFEPISKIPPMYEENDDEPSGPETAASRMNPNDPSVSESDTIIFAVQNADVFNYALYKNDITPIRSVCIINKTHDPIPGLRICVTSDSDIFEPYSSELPPIPVKTPPNFPIPIKVHAKELADITEAIKVNFKAELLNAETDEPICPPVEWVMDVLTYDESAGPRYEQYLAAFSMPNHPYLPELQNEASSWLKRNGKDSSFEQFQANDPNRIREFAAACFAAIQKKNITYLVAPASFGRGQRIRTVDKVLDERLGNCMDMTMLYASLMESIGMHVILILVKGHIFAGVWLKNEFYNDPVINNGSILLKEPQMTFVECTMMCSNEKPISFDSAEETARTELDESINNGNFQLAIDICSVRKKLGILPIDARVSTNTAIIGNDLDNDELTSAPEHITFTNIETKGPEKATGPKNKIELWESKLLDLSERNKLLNLPQNSSIIPLISSHIGELEDSLTDGEVFSIQQVSTTGKDGKIIVPSYEGISTGQLSPELIDYFRAEIKSHRLYGFSKDNNLDKNLKAIFRKAREGEREYGINSLYLALGMLRWFDPEDEQPKPLYAPLILAPVEIEMKPGGVGYNLRRRFEDPHFNITLLEMLRQRFDLAVSDLEPLPVDEHGLDVMKIFALVRGAVKEIPHWDVVETAAIGIFDISKIAMWNDIHTAPEMLMDNKVVRSLIMQRVDWDVTKIAEAPKDYTTFVTLPVDATQLEAIDLAARGNTFVLHGPPGTGKSQTITGLIGNALANHKTVLFVAEKATALNVVRNRLDSDLNIGDFCLALHADSEKTAVLEQIEKTMGKKVFLNLSPFDSYADRTEAQRKKLDDYALRLHQKQPCGFTLRELIDAYSCEPEDAPYISFRKDAAAALSAEDIRSHIPLIEQLLAARKGLDETALSLMGEIGLSSYDGEIRGALGARTEAYRDALEQTAAAAGRAAGLLNLAAPETMTDLAMLAQRVSGIHALAASSRDVPDISKIDTEGASRYFAEKTPLEIRHNELLKLWAPEFLQKDPADYRNRLAAAQKKFLGRGKAVSRVMNELESYAHRPLSESEVPALLKGIEDFRRESARVEAIKNGLSQETRSLMALYPDEAAFRQAYASAAAYRQQVASLTGGSSLRDLQNNTAAAEILQTFGNAWQQLQERQAETNAFLQRSHEKTRTASIRDEVEFCGRILNNRNSIKRLALYNQYRAACIRAGLEPVVKACEQNGMDDLETIRTAYRKGLYYALINNIITHDNLLSAFTGDTFNTSIGQYKKLDDDLREKSIKELYHRLAYRLPSDLESPAIAKQLTILRKAIKSRGRGISLRQLFAQIPDILYRICPCMLMSPETVAQYLPQQNDLFDLVVFDEASQISTSRAIGALARGKDAVIVGDPEQMPPTNFFGGGPRVEAPGLEDLDSILDDALAIGIPSRYLKWHYRSSHESLIAFSNRNFYHNEMFTFPSVDDRARRVRRIWVESNYKKSVNENEAKEIVKEVIRRFRTDKDPAKGTIGIIAFNEKQRDFIDDMLEKQCQEDRALSDWVHMELGKKTKVEIKALEKVQGDEWDTVIFSITFGPDEKGHVLQNFGPINKEGGGKRLNVAFSRAIREMLIFTGMRSSDIKTGDSTPDGVRAFHDFLEFTERLDTAGQPETSAPSADYSRSGIVQRICSVLADNGYAGVADIGSSDFHIDIGVLNPYEPSKYLLGILLDGDTYKQTQNTHDREIGQSGLLKGRFGWELYRIWALDWWDDREFVLDQLIEKLNTLKAAAAQAAQHTGVPAEEEDFSAEDAALDAKLTKEAGSIEAEMDDSEYEPDEAPVPGAGTEAPRVDPAPAESPAEQKAPTDAGADEPIQEPETSGADVPETADETEEPEEADEVPSGKPQPTLRSLLAEAGVEAIDKRDVGGLLWIIGGRELEPLIARCREIGVAFTFKEGGGKVCRGRDAWWTSNDAPITATDPEMREEPEPDTAEKGPDPLTGMESLAEDVRTDDRSGMDGDTEKNAESHDTETDAEPYTGTLFVPVVLKATSCGWQEYCRPSNKAEIGRRAALIVEGEGVIERAILIDRLRNSYWVNLRAEVTEATEKALKAAKIKTTKVKGIPYCWASDIDPKTYTGFHYHDENKRDPEDLPLPEMRNAVVRTLMDNGPLDEDALLVRTARTFGYQRLGPNLKKRLAEGIEYAVSDRKIRLNKQKRYELREG